MFSTRALGAWRFVHTWTSLVCTAFLLMLCLTGLPLIFQDEIEDAFPGGAAPATVAPGTALVSLDRIAVLARAHYPREALRSLFIDDDAPQVFAILAPSVDAPANQSHFLIFDAHTAALLRDSLHADGGSVEAFMTFVRTLHAEMFLGLLGDFVLAFVGLLFLGALVSGVVLYAPFARRAPFGTVRRDGSNRLRWLDLHNVPWHRHRCLAVRRRLHRLDECAVHAAVRPVADHGLVAKLLAGYDKLPVVTPTSSIQGAMAATLRAVPGAVVPSSPCRRM